MSIPEAAIEAAGDEVWSMTGGSPDSRAIAEQALTAAMPAIREAIAQEVEAAEIVGRFTYPGLVQAKAAAIVRGGAA